MLPLQLALFTALLVVTGITATTGVSEGEARRFIAFALAFAATDVACQLTVIVSSPASAPIICPSQ